MCEELDVGASEEPKGWYQVSGMVLRVRGFDNISKLMCQLRSLKNVVGKFSLMYTLETLVLSKPSLLNVLIDTEHLI